MSDADALQMCMLDPFMGLPVFSTLAPCLPCLPTHRLFYDVSNAEALEARLPMDERSDFPLTWRGSWAAFGPLYMVGGCVWVGCTCALAREAAFHSFFHLPAKQQESVEVRFVFRQQTEHHAHFNMILLMHCGPQLPFTAHGTV